MARVIGLVAETVGSPEPTVEQKVIEAVKEKPLVGEQEPVKTETKKRGRPKK